MAKSVVGLFNNMTAAEAVVRDLEAAGFHRADISILAGNEANRYQDYVGRAKSDEGDAAACYQSFSQLTGNECESPGREECYSAQPRFEFCHAAVVQSPGGGRGLKAQHGWKMAGSRR